MLNVWAYLCGTTHQSFIDATDPRNPYTPKQMSFSYLTNSCTITFGRFKRAVGRYNFV